MAQICAEALGVDYRRVRVIHGQTDRIAHGIGAHAARATVLTGGAVHATAVKLRDKALAFAAELLQTPAAELDIVDGMVRAAGAARPARRSRSGEIARRSLAPGLARPARGREPGLAAQAGSIPITRSSAYGVHFAVVRIDRDTGRVAVERFMDRL